MAFRHISELFADWKPMRFSDGFAEYIYNPSATNEFIHCYPHYVNNRYNFDFQNVPQFDSSLFELAKMFQGKQVSVRTLWEVSSYEFVYPFTTLFLENLTEGVTSLQENKIIQKFIDQDTYIYLIQDEDTGYTKIGRSNNPQQRLKQLIKQDTLMPRPNRFYLREAWQDTAQTEIALHKEFSAQRVRGEWFDLSTQDISRILEFSNNRPLFF